MALIWTTTAAHAAKHGVKVCVYARAGAGKTVLCSTAPRPIIASAEAGTLSIAANNIPMAVIGTMADLLEFLNWLKMSHEAKNFDTVCLDSISEIAEKLLSDEVKKAKDPRQAYGTMSDQIAVNIRQFRDLPEKHVYFSAKCELRDAPNGIKMYGPMMPGKNTTTALPYFFDEFFHLGMQEYVDPAKPGTPVIYRYLQTQPDNQFEAKDRSGFLDKMEPPNLTHIFNKITAGIAARAASLAV